MQTQDRYLQPHQARRRPATTYEDLLGDVIERAVGEGTQWTEELYRKELAALAA